MDFAWRYLRNTGVRTENCMPYTSQKGSDDGNVEGCPANGQCSPTGKSKFPEEIYKKYKCKGDYSHYRGVDTIKQEIFDNGPLELAYTVYQDFMSY